MEIAVSIICNAYNHEKYIRETLESFVMQECNFKYEVLIHDDASTDGTVAIIREYEKKFPEMIFPIYQTENQYSKGISVTKTYQYPRVRGKYIAFCEGDDFWSDALKLQKQYDTMEKHSDIDICAHAASIIKNGKKIGKIAPVSKSQIIPLEMVIAGGGAFVATNSLMYRTSLLKSEMRFEKEVYFDYVMQIKGALRGGMLYLSDSMSTYRQAVNGSWTMGMVRNPEKWISHLKRVKSMLQILNEETDYQYNQVIYNQLLHEDFEIYCAKREYGNIWKNKEIIKKLSIKDKIKLVLKSCIYFIKHN